MSRETYFKKGAWISGFQYYNEAQLEQEIEHQEDLLGKYKSEFAIRLGMNNPDGDAEDLFFDFEELWNAMQDVTFMLARLYVIDQNKEYIDNGEDE